MACFDKKIESAFQQSISVSLYYSVYWVAGKIPKFTRATDSIKESSVKKKNQAEVKVQIV